MKTVNNKILTFLNIEEPIETIVGSAVNLAKTFQAEVNFFYVKKKIDATRTENQLDVMRTMAIEQKAVQKLKNVLTQKQKNTDAKLSYTITEGPLKKTVQSKLDSYRPDMVVLGKRTPNVYRVVGKQITELVLKNFNGPVLIAHPSRVLEIEEDLSVGVLNDLDSILENKVSNTLMKQSKAPLKLFRIDDTTPSTADVKPPGTKTIDYRFENNQNALKNLTTYVHKNNVHLLCVERTKDNPSSKNLKLKQVIKHVNTSMLMVGRNDSNNIIKV